MKTISMIRQQLFDIVAFAVPNHKSLLYKRFLTVPQLKEAVEMAVKKGANVISIRMVIR